MAISMQGFRRWVDKTTEVIGDHVVEVDVLHSTLDAAASVQSAAVGRAQVTANAWGKSLTVEGTTTKTVNSTTRLTTVRMRLLEPE